MQGMQGGLLLVCRRKVVVVVLVVLVVHVETDAEQSALAPVLRQKP